MAFTRTSSAATTPTASALPGQDTTDVFIQENHIGANSSGTDLGNSGSGVHVTGGSNNNFIEVNIIANNTGDGVTITGTSAFRGSRIWENSIHDNEGEGIDLGDDGPTANDTGDRDSGPNHLQNYPANITFATRGNDVASVRFTLDITANRRYIVDFYSCDSSTSGEGKVWLGYTRFTPAATGNATVTASTFTGSINSFTAPESTAEITATATDTDDELHLGVRPLRGAGCPGGVDNFRNGSRGDRGQHRNLHRESILRSVLGLDGEAVCSQLQRGHRFPD